MLSSGVRPRTGLPVSGKFRGGIISSYVHFVLKFYTPKVLRVGQCFNIQCLSMKTIWKTVLYPQYLLRYDARTRCYKDYVRPPPNVSMYPYPSLPYHTLPYPWRWHRVYGNWAIKKPSPRRIVEDRIKGNRLVRKFIHQEAQSRKLFSVMIVDQTTV